MTRSWKSIFSLPAVRFLLFLVMGITLAHFGAGIGRSGIITAVIAMLGFFAAFAFRNRTMRILAQSIAIGCVIIVLGAMRAADDERNIDTALLRYADSGQPLRLHGVVTSFPEPKEGSCSFLMDVDTISFGVSSYPVRTNTFVRYTISPYEAGDSLTPIEPGDRILAVGGLSTPRDKRNPGGFDYRSFLARQGVATAFSVSSGDGLRILDHRAGGNGLKRWLFGIRMSMHRAICRLYPGESGNIMLGLLLGERGFIGADITRTFRNAGVIHILTISGTHVGLIFLIIWLLLGRLDVRIRIATTLALLWLYASVTGMAPPVARAVLMTSVVLIGIGIQRVTNRVNALAFAGIIILFVSPSALFESGFQLSFMAALSILLFYDRIVQAFMFRFPRLASNVFVRTLSFSLAITLSAQLCTIPLVISYFQQISLISFAANLVIVPMIFVSMALSFPALLFSCVGTYPALWFALSSGWVLRLSLLLTAFFANLPFAVVRIHAFSAVYAAAYFVSLAILFGRPGRFRNKAAIVILLAAVTMVFVPVFSEQQNNAVLRVTYLDVGQGDATLLEFPDGNAMLIDAGPMNNQTATSEPPVVSFLRTRGISTLHSFVMTHPDGDHTGAAVEVMKNFGIRNVYYSGDWSVEEPARTILAFMNGGGAHTAKLSACAGILIDPNARVYVISPPPSANNEPASNTTSLSFVVQYGRTKFLFTGDADAPAEDEMVSRFGDLLSCDVYKVGHHGSASSSTPRFVLKTKPAFAVISCGRNNRFHHPREEILSRLRLLGAEIHRTDVEGAIILESNGERVQVVSWR